MATWDEIRDEVAGMLADGKPLEDVLAKLKKLKNEMVKANLLKAMDEMKKPKPMTNEEYLRSCTTEQLAEFIVGQRKGCVYADCPNGETPCMSCKDGCDIDKLVEWLKQPHTFIDY